MILSCRLPRALSFAATDAPIRFKFIVRPYRKLHRDPCDVDDARLRHLAYGSYERYPYSAVNTGTRPKRRATARIRGTRRLCIWVVVRASRFCRSPYKRLIAARQQRRRPRSDMSNIIVFWRLLYEPHLCAREIFSTRICRQPCNFDRFSSRSSG